MVERLRFAVDHIRLAIRYRFAVALHRAGPNASPNELGLRVALGCHRNARSEGLAIVGRRRESYEAFTAMPICFPAASRADR